MTVSRLRQTAEEKPVELVAAIVMVIAGVLVAVISKEQALVGLGGILATVGGALFSWVAAAVGSTEQAVQVLRPQLESTSRQLGTVSGQIGRAVVGAQEDHISAETAFALVLQSNRTLYSFVTELQLLTGTQLDTQVLVNTMEQLEELAERITTYGAPEDEVGATSKQHGTDENTRRLTEEIESIRLQLGSQLAGLGSGRRRSAAIKVACPSCQTAVDWRLGLEAGDSCMPQCAACGLGFHAHRRPDGTVFTREKGSASVAAGYSPQAYERILKDQGIRLVPPKWRPRALRSLAQAIEDSKEGYVESWEVLEDETAKILREGGNMVDLLEVKKVRQLAYRAKVFAFREGGGIRLAPGVDPSSISAHVDRALVDRIMQFTEENVDPDAVNDLLHAGDPSRLNEIQQHVTELSENQSEAPSEGEPVQSG